MGWPKGKAREITTQKEQQAKTIREIATKLQGAFDWEKTLEGFSYWDTVYKNLKTVADGM